MMASGSVISRAAKAQKRTPSSGLTQEDGKTGRKMGRDSLKAFKEAAMMETF